MRKANPIDVLVGKKLREIRQEKGVSQDELAKHILVTFQQVQKYEKGQNRVSASKLYEMSKYLKISISRFFENVSDYNQFNSKPMTVADAANGDFPGADLDGLNRLIRAYNSVSDSELRKRILFIVESLAKENDLDDRRQAENA